MGSSGVAGGQVGWHVPDHHAVCVLVPAEVDAHAVPWISGAPLAQVLVQKPPSPAKADEVQVAQLSSNTRINRAPEVDPQGFGFHLECVPVGLARLDFGVLAGQQLKAGVQEVRVLKGTPFGCRHCPLHDRDAVRIRLGVLSNVLERPLPGRWSAA